jgi:predicted PurR-regulated permease PerM
VRLFDRQTFAVLFTTLVVAAVLWMTWAARRTLLAFLFAVFFAYLLEPVVRAVQRSTGGRRLWAIAITYLALLVVLGAAIVAAAPRFAEQAPVLAQTIPAFAAQVSSGEIAQTIGRQHGWNYRTRTALARSLKQWITANRDTLTNAMQDAGTRAAAVSGNLGWIVLIPILSLFFLKDKAAFGDAVVGFLADERQRGYWRAVLHDLDLMLAHYIRAQLTLAFLAMIAYTSFLAVMGFPYALGLGVVGGVLEFIPFVGPAITAALLLLLGFFGGYAHWLVVLAFVGVWRGIQDYVTAPYLMGEGLELHPLAAIFGVLAGGEIAGIAGMFLSIPVIAGLRILWRNRRLVGRQADDPLARITPSL